MPVLAPDRAREIQRMTEFEEHDYMGLMMKKEATWRQKQDKQDLVLGGKGSVMSGAVAAAWKGD